ncbi:hypothetical protein SKAU_G00067060 [Synaphobranchus kaupii]|uniref:E-selectin n=1 Tax=Synaphobranchus kaupii TaxID=118154 RepID=A0A9Q1JA67_SYNKA|nr:hypothetical protein SKAU_G00067060 [Synaphobranchus kaupii]
MRGCRLSLRQGSQQVKLKWILILICDIFMTEYALGWTYHYSNETMNWVAARQWCQVTYTDLVAIQNKDEISYLHKTFPKKNDYYWIGIRKINGTWTWIGTNKTIEEKNGYWAEKEPNNKKDEDCVEIYIKRVKDWGKWNDENCGKLKHPLCFKAHCNATTCGNRGECTETINNYTCKCALGFEGPHCRDAVQCESPVIPQHGRVDCRGPHGNHNYRSTCEFHCTEGFSLQGQAERNCNASGEWTGTRPVCKGVDCKALSEPEGGYVNCSGSSTTSNSTCEFSCSKGFLLLGPRKVTCSAAGIWMGKSPFCASFMYVAAAFAGTTILSTSCFIVVCLMHCRKRKNVQTGPPEEDRPQPGDEFEASCECIVIHEKMLLWGHCISQKCHFGLLIGLFALGYDLSAETGVQAWTYHYSISPNRNWNSARDWCRQHYTDMVAIQNQGEIAYLNENLPKNRYYYWIGIRKVRGLWTWVGTNKTLTRESENWAKREPNNRGKKQQEDCVEIYIKRDSEAGKWNDNSCKNAKGALCYHASCREQSCRTQTECVETIGNYTCNCHPGFQGLRCEEAVACGFLQAPERGSLQCTHTYGSFRFNSSCAFRCAQGFLLKGASHLQCQASGRWDADPPSCQAVKCPELSRAPTRGSMNCSHPVEPHSFDSTCDFTCEEGFVLKGPSSIQCNPSGSWTDDMPICEARRCDVLTAPLHGSLHCSHPHEEFSFNSSCNVTCEEGFLLNGTASIQCTSLGLWTEPLSLCQARQCLPLVAPSRGQMNCSHPHSHFSFGSSCELGCEEGFVLRGAPTLQCTESGLWSHTAPSCQARRCDVLIPPLHGSLHCSHPHEEFSFNSSCNVSCEEGFLLNGTASIQCTSLGMWTELLPLCQARQCLPLVAPSRGQMNCSHPHSHFSFGSSCELGCEEGFVLRGAPTLQCTESGLWSHTAPSCQARRCDVLTAPLHGSLHCSHPHEEFSFNSSCNMSCEEGFLLNGTASIQCTSLGVWTEPLPLCQARRCDVLTPPLHGSLHCSHPHEEFSFNSSCNVSCEEGFLLNGTASIQCTSLGMWTELLPLCQARQCLPLVAPSKGQMNCSHPHSHFSFGSSCELGCEEGFVLRGAPTLQCTESGLWSHTAPSCQVRRCDVLTAPLHGSLHCSHPHEEFSFNSRCDMSCEDGFLLNRTASIQCTSLGVWTEPLPLCQARQCLPLVAPSRGQMNCSHPHSHFSFGSSCELGCEEGFVLRGAPTLQCTESGLWSHTAPSCQAQRCDVRTAPLHGSLHCFHPHEEFSFNSSCNVTCEEGFLLNRTASIQCTSLGVWTEPLPLCQARQCLPLVAPSRGQMNCSHPHSHFSFGSSCELGCEEGFVLRGAPTLQCTESGLWSHTAPSCRARRCDVLTPPLHGSLHCSHPHEEFSFNSSCNVSCEEGFLLNGTASIQCTSLGGWTEPLPLCQAQQCLPLVAPGRGQMNCSHPHSHFSFGSSCELGCEEGFVLRGAPTLQCTESGLWSHTVPSCQARRCDILTAPLYGSLHCSHPYEEFSFNSSCNLSCEEGFLLNGTASIQCTSLGLWTEPLPLCQARQCLPLVAPSRGQMNCSHPHSHFSFGSSCELACEEGFVLRGAPTLQCTESGLWSHTVPSCQARRCDVQTAPLHGSLNCSHPHEEFSFNSSCNVTCEEGFLLNGTASIQCTSLGLWTEPPPICQVVRCQTLGDLLPPFLSAKCSDPLGIFSFGSQCFFHCGNGSTLNGTARLSCASNGMWNAPRPSCTEPQMTVGTGMLISAGVGFASAISLLLLCGLVFLTVSHLSRRAQKQFLEARDIAIWEELENPAFEEDGDADVMIHQSLHPNSGSDPCLSAWLESASLYRARGRVLNTVLWVGRLPAGLLHPVSAMIFLASHQGLVVTAYPHGDLKINPVSEQHSSSAIRPPMPGWSPRTERSKNAAPPFDRQKHNVTLHDGGRAGSSLLSPFSHRRLPHALLGWRWITRRDRARARARGCLPDCDGPRVPPRSRVTTRDAA